jgi:uncharacterized protein YbbK (DUF523 family)
LGEKVRYDGGHKLNIVLKDALDKYNIKYIPVCPEAECGLGVPRKSMHLEGNYTDPRLIITDTGEDMTDRMVNWAQNRIIQLEKENIRGFIFKSDSPNCGIKTVNVFNRNALPSKTATGIFAAMVMKHFPLLPTEDEENLKNPTLLENFIERICAFAK